MRSLIIAAVWCAFIAVTNARGSPPKIIYGNKWSFRKGTSYVKREEISTFNCSAEANPAAMYYWTFNGARLDPNPGDGRVKYDEKNGTLTAGINFGSANSGDYQCYAYNDHGTSMTPILTILAAYHNSFKGDNIDYISAVVTKYQKLDCNNVRGSVPWWTFNWKKGTYDDVTRKVVFKDLDLISNKRIQLDKAGSLHFAWVEKTDAGIYACAVTNDLYRVTYTNTETITLTVADGLKETRGPEVKFCENVQVDAGAKAELLCIFSYYSADPSEQLDVKWLFGGKIVGTGVNITLTDVKISDEGEYLVVAKLGTEANPKLRLKVVSPPTFIDGRMLVGKSVPVEKNAVFQCGTYSHKTYSLPPVWLVNGKPLIGCPERYFECSETLADGFSQCIPEEKGGKSDICDNDPTCSDSSDEHNCLAMTCPESQKQCRDQCVQASSPCEELICNYPNFMCRDELKCVSSDMLCNGNDDCRDGSDEFACPNRDDIQRGRFNISSDRTRLTLPSVSLTDGMCFQCMVTNQYGTAFGDGCLSVIDKIVILKGPNSTYDVEPDTRIVIIMEAITDIKWQNQMNFTWQWYEEVTDENTGDKKIVAKKLPPQWNLPLSKSFFLSNKGKNMTIVFPAVKEDDTEAYDIYNKLIDRVYTVIIQHEYDRVELNFTIIGKEIVKPVPIVEAASTNLWFIALILGILLLFIVVALIICYLHRNRGGTYLLDKKEHQAGHDPEKELKDGGFQDVGRVDDGDGDQGEKMSLSESVKPYESDDDPTIDYGGELDFSKFNEEGSFIGAYGEKTKEATV